MKKLTALVMLVAILLPLFASQVHACGMGKDKGGGEHHEEIKE